MLSLEQDEARTPQSCQFQMVYWIACQLRLYRHQTRWALCPVQTVQTDQRMLDATSSLSMCCSMRHKD